MAKGESKSVVVYCDHRERNSGVLGALAERGAVIEEKQLKVGDFILGDGVCCERKTANDFINSLIDGRLFEQCAALKENFERPFFVIEGVSDAAELLSERRVNPKAVRGALISLKLDRGMPVFYTRDAAGTAELLHHVAEREQLMEKKENRLRGERKPLTLEEKQLYVIEGFPGVGAKQARRILEHFGSIKRFVNATLGSLQRVDKIGGKKAQEFRKIIDSEYSEGSTARL